MESKREIFVWIRNVRTGFQFYFFMCGRLLEIRTMGILMKIEVMDFIYVHTYIMIFHIGQLVAFVSSGILLREM